MDEFAKEATGTPPIFFYCGNEGEVWSFYNNTGQLTFPGGWADQAHALVVFAEHRFYGESMPFGKDFVGKPEYTKYLTLEQAMMDFVALIKYLKS